MKVGRYCYGDPMRLTPAVFFGILERIDEVERFLRREPLSEMDALAVDQATIVDEEI